MTALQELPRAVRRWPSIRQTARDPARAQSELWSRTAALLQRAPFWQARMPPLEELPVTTYADYAEAIERSWVSETSELNGEPIEYWALSSGSSGAQKRFPWTETFLSHYIEGSDLTLPIFQAIARAKGRGPLLALVATNPKTSCPTGVPAGYASNYFGSEDNGIYPRVIDFDKELFTRWMPLYAMSRNLGGFRAVSCDHVFLLLDRIDAERDFYARLIRGEGRMPAALPRPELSADRRAHLEAALASPDALRLSDLWPSLSVVHTWRAATAGLQADQLARTAGCPIRLIDFTYATSEGPIANPVDPDAIGGPINPTSMLHEFLEVGAAGTPENVRKAWELEPGRLYEILLTTTMGLVRYRIGDVVCCTGHYERTPTLRFHGRATGELSLGVTTFSEWELVGALAEVGLSSGASARRVFGPGPDGRALLLYTTEPVDEEQLERIHRSLAAANDTYRGFESEGRVARVGQQVLPPDHPVWAHCAPAHAQAKPVLLIDRPADSFRG